MAGRVTTAEQRADATALRRLLGALRDARDLVDVGAYGPGSNALVVAALARQAAIESFLRQPVDDVAPTTESWTALRRLVRLNVVTRIDGNTAYVFDDPELARWIASRPKHAI